MKRNQSQGFAHVFVLVLLVLVIAASAFGGWYVWKKNHKATPATNSSSPNSQNNTNQSKQEPANKDDEYLIIKEWGVRFLVPKELEGDISYFVNDRANRDFGGPIRVDFTSAEFSTGQLKCAVVEGDSPRSIVSIYREIDGDGGATNEPTSFKRIGDTRYYFLATACEEAVTREGSAHDKQLVADLKKALADLEKY